MSLRNNRKNKTNTEYLNRNKNTNSNIRPWFCGGCLSLVKNNECFLCNSKKEVFGKKAGDWKCRNCSNIAIL